MNRTINTTESDSSNVGTTTSDTINDGLTRTITQTESGNKSFKTNQELVKEELELRKKNFYDSILTDVVKLLTLSIY